MKHAVALVKLLYATIRPYKAFISDKQKEKLTNLANGAARFTCGVVDL